MTSMKARRTQTLTRRRRQAYPQPTTKARPTGTRAPLDTPLGYDRIPPLMRWL